MPDQGRCHWSDSPRAYGNWSTIQVSSKHGKKWSKHHNTFELIWSFECNHGDSIAFHVLGTHIVPIFYLPT